MPFTDLRFLLLFLPAAVGGYQILPQKIRLWFVVANGLAFLWLSQPYYMIFFVFFIVLNYLLGRWLYANIENIQISRVILWISLLVNLGLLIAFKLLAQYPPLISNFIAIDVVNTKASTLSWIFPLGFSYIIFQVIAYFLDIKNEITPAEPNILKFSSLLLFFPKMIAGPIQRYRDSISELNFMATSPTKVAEGLRRFIQGLAKKVILADTIAKFIDPVFSQTIPNVTTLQAWMVLIGYSIQLYYDFSGYTDMAIGLGEAFGLKMVENFNWPYISKNVTEFWRRWHISLSSWFRDYVFIPIQYHLRKQKRYPIQLTILLVFLLTGLWHGFHWHFVAWGLMLGAIIGLEATKFGKLLQKAWIPLQHLWMLFWILMSWVLFRSPGISFAINFYKSLFGLQGELTLLPFSQTIPFPVIENSVKIAFILGAILAVPLIPWIKSQFGLDKVEPSWFTVVRDLCLVVLLIYCLGLITSNGPMPGIYGAF